MSVLDSISKEAVIKSIGEMPDRVSMEELFDRIIYLFKIEEGLAQSKRGEGAPIDQVREKMKAWRNEKSS
ncbi:MAG: hypothetical protein DYG98_13490 [Haliscomenobacteraceae bacterium CHB4]|nr:hypothetical protein [Saprospiraceae bacterium]MCE7924062.1 hypothetical protein [Haliscomenobacteraceae bacterium CHB4]